MVASKRLIPPQEPSPSPSLSPSPSPASAPSPSPSPAPLGVYVHFPWCRQRCPYCEFAIAVPSQGRIPHDAYAGAVVGELRARASLFRPGRELVSVYFGGGTPSLWSAESVRLVVAEIGRIFSPAAGREVEVSLEANPEDCCASTLAAWHAAGINRLSLGAQSLVDGELGWLGRRHRAADVALAVAAARRVGIANVSVDLIFGLPRARAEDWRRSLEGVVATGASHLSVYSLSVEPRSTFGAARRRQALELPEEDAVADEFEQAHDLLAAAGYEHYEVSNYARPGMRAQHNCLYWSNSEYLGLGCAAWSYWRPIVVAPGETAEGAPGIRWGAHRSVVRYLASQPSPPGGFSPSTDGLVAQYEELDAAAMATDAIWLGMRTVDGVPLELVASQEPAVRRLQEAGLVVLEEGRLRPTRRGLMFADEIGVALAFSSD
ncbi:MAG: radical SAM family heme chaperone HemW [Pseudomonadota bacterium]